jgi:hypothetical protein
MSIQVILAQAGPLPITVSFNAPGDEPMWLEVNGSVWSQIGNQMIGFSVELDNNVLGQAQIFSNDPTTHRAVVPAYFEVQLNEEQYSLTLTRANISTVSDSNDNYTAVLHY